jgi:hypothetical protein
MSLLTLSLPLSLLAMLLAPRAAVGAAALLAAPCFDGPNGTHTALRTRQEFKFDVVAGGPATLASDPSQCLTAVSPGSRGSELTVAPCSTSSAKGQSWAPMPNASTSTLRLQTGGGTVGLQNGGLTNAVLWLGPGSGQSQRSAEGAEDSHTDGAVQRAELGPPRPPLVSFQPIADGGANHGVFLVSPRGGFNQAVGCGRGCSLCASFGPPVRPCDAPSPAAALPMCDTSLPVEQRVADLVTRIPESDITKLLVNIAGPVPSLWISSQNWRVAKTAGRSHIFACTNNPFAKTN